MGLLTPVFTLVLYAGLAKAKGLDLDTETAFTTVAILALVIHPANMIMTIFPQMSGSLASFERIQNYLLEPLNHDRRIVIDDPAVLSLPALRTMPEYVPQARAIHVQDLSVVYPENSQATLRNINLNVERGTVVILTGRVGSGKSTLARTILGEVTPSRGVVSCCSERIAYCSQTAWLPNRTIRDCIYGLGSGAKDAVRYGTVVKACCLDHDLEELPQGHDTIVGNRGSNLSGGQRQRVVSLKPLRTPKKASNDDVLIGFGPGPVFKG